MKLFLEAIEWLDASPPRFVPSPRRSQAFHQIDRFLASETRARAPFDLAGPQGPAVWQIVAARLERALDTARYAELDHEEVWLWQMYNHGILIKSDEITMGFDVIAMPRRFGWAEPVALRQRIAQSLDVLCVTHRHPDHFDHALVGDCLRLGRPVILPKALADEWGYDPNLYAMDDGDVLELYDLKIRARRGLHVWRATDDEVPLTLYDVVCQSGYRFVFGGDVDYTAPMGRAPWRGKPNLFFVPWRSPNARYEPGHADCIGQPIDALRTLLNTTHPKMLLFEHYAELEHVYDGFEPSYELALSLQQQIEIPSELLFWGESVQLQPFVSAGRPP